MSKPWLGEVLPVTVRPVPRSLTRTVEPLSGVLAAVVAESFVAVGVTVSETVAVAVDPLLSVTVYVNESGPEYPADGV